MLRIQKRSSSLPAPSNSNNTPPSTSPQASTSSPPTTTSSNSAADDPSHELIFREDTVDRQLLLSCSPLMLKLLSVSPSASDSPLLTDLNQRLKYVYHCLQQLNHLKQLQQQLNNNYNNSQDLLIAPQEELAYAIQALHETLPQIQQQQQQQTAIKSHQQQLIQQQQQQQQLSSPSSTHSGSSSSSSSSSSSFSPRVDDLSTDEVGVVGVIPYSQYLVSEDVIPRDSTARLNYSNVDGTNRLGYLLAADESQRFSDLQANLEYVSKCLKAIQFNQGANSRKPIILAPESEQAAYSITEQSQQQQHQPSKQTHKSPIRAKL